MFTSSHVKEIYWVTILQCQLWWHPTQFNACVEPWPNPQNLSNALWNYFLNSEYQRAFCEPCTPTTAFHIAKCEIMWQITQAFYIFAP
jgi:hypothetical protein